MAKELYTDIDKYIKKEDNKALDDFEVNTEIEVVLVPYKEISYKVDSGYGAYACELVTDKDEMPDTFTISGNFISELNIGQTYKARGIVVTYNKNKQLKVEEIKKIEPKTVRTIKQFLKSLNGMGPFYDVIYDEFGEKSLDMIRTQPLEVKKVAPALYDELVYDWQRQLLMLKDSQEYLTAMMNYGFKPIQAKKYFDLYQELCLDKIKENPYRLINELSGFGFLKCDTIAKNIGFAPDSVIRIQEALLYTLKTSKYYGNTYMTKKELLQKTGDLLAIKVGSNEMKKLFKGLDGTKTSVLYKVGNLTFEIGKKDIIMAMDEYSKARSKAAKESAKLVIFNIPPEKIEEQINFLKVEGKLIYDVEKGKIYDKVLYNAEDFIAQKLIRILRNEKPIQNLNIESLLQAYLKNQNIELEDRQYEAVMNSANSIGGFSIINGSAGCGKTFTLNIALKLIEYVYVKTYGYFEPIILAPTGRAAKVAAMATEREASTIHKALKLSSEGGFFYNAQNFLPYQCIICDETSMLDVEIARHLFEAIANKTKVIFIGDTKQLPSVGPGNVLKDIINSRMFKVTTLNVVKRQSLESGIYKNAQRIINGEMITSEKDIGDAYVYKAIENDRVVDKILSLYARLHETLTLDQIQVLAPQKTGLVGTNYLNFILQDKFNHENKGLRVLNKLITVTLPNGETGKFELYFKQGDKIIHTENDYNLPWYQLVDNHLQLDPNGYCGVSNGETGRIVTITEAQDENRNTVTMIIVKYNEKYIIYSNDFSQLDHAYCMTIHKSQGSEWPAVLIPITFSSYNMLERNLIYTGYTRAKKWIGVVGDPEAIRYAIETEKSSERQTGLMDRLFEWAQVQI